MVATPKRTIHDVANLLHASHDANGLEHYLQGVLGGPCSLAADELPEMSGPIEAHVSKYHEIPHTKRYHAEQCSQQLAKRRKLLALAKLMRQYAQLIEKHVNTRCESYAEYLARWEKRK